MMQCKVCFKYRNSINEHGECDKCVTVANRLRDVVLHVKNRGRDEMTPFLGNRKILKKEEWLKLRKSIDRFYNNISMDDIQRYNEKVVSPIARAKLGKNNDSGVIYLLKSNIGFFKIGKSRDLERRVGEHLRNYPVSLDVIHVVIVEEMTKCESYLLSVFSDRKMQGEWFALTSEDVEWICGLDADSLETLSKQGPVARPEFINHNEEK